MSAKSFMAAVLRLCLFRCEHSAFGQPDAIQPGFVVEVLSKFYMSRSERSGHEVSPHQGSEPDSLRMGSENCWDIF